MLPLSLASEGGKYKIRKIGGSDRIRQHLEELGFVVGAVVIVVSAIDGNLIVNVKDSRVAINAAMAQRILV